MGKCGLDATGIGQGPLVVPCEHNNKPLLSIKGGAFLDLMNDY
jgi:hypothetical protein